MPPDWDVEADVVVVGFGAAGACAALEAAAAGCSVLILDRFGGGGATALSGGVVYAGGGTPQQRAAGVTDTPEAMLGYLRTEVGDAVPETTLREFCDGSVGMLAWLEGHGVPFEGSLCPDKTSYPTNRHYLYYSGSELSAAASETAASETAASETAAPGGGAPGAGTGPPAPRGHRTRGRGTSGGLLYARLAAAVRGAGARVLTQTAARQLVTDPGGRVTGVECLSLRDAPAGARLAHRVLHRWSVKPYLYVPKLGRILHRPVGWLEHRYAQPLRIGAARGVILAAGGFAANRPMMRAHAPNARGGLPLATPGDDGSGIRLGTQAGGATAFLDRVSVWRFLSPPPALLAGVLVDRAGQRVCDESRYGAALGDAILRHGGRAWLFVDHATRAQARRQVRGATLWFQRLQAWYLLSLGAVRAPTVAAVAARVGVDPDGLAATVAAYNAASRNPAASDPAAHHPAAHHPVAHHQAAHHPAAPDPAGKPAAVCRPQDQPPYYLIDVSVRPRLFYPAPVLTLGGLVVAPGSGQVLRPDGRPVEGLYAAGRTAAGLCSRSYVSGLSLADCVFSARRAARHAATAPASVRFPSGGIVMKPHWPVPAGLHTASRLPVEGELPSFDGATGWLNSPPLTPAGLRGKVVLANFWTYTCINWLRQLPYVRAWAEKYAGQGLVVIGVHTPEFGFEHDEPNVRRAVTDMRITYPVAIDDDYAVWRAFDNHYWPALYFADAQGRIRHHHYGEGEYPQSEMVIQQLLAEAGVRDVGIDVVTPEAPGLEAPADWTDLRSPENYTGYERTENFASPGILVPDRPQVYDAPSQLRLNHWALAGDWTAGAQATTLNEAGGRIAYRFQARDLHLVTGPQTPGTAVRFQVRIDGQPPGDDHGGDVDAEGHGTITEQRLHQLIRQRGRVTERTFEMTFLDPGVQTFSFTFG